MSVEATVAPKTADASLGSFAYTQADFRCIAALARAEAGIQLNATKAPLVYSRLVKRLRALGLQSFRDYCALVSGENGAEERQCMTAALTTNVTRFFREGHHFSHLHAKVLPDLVRQARRGGRVRIWSAGCSSGEEPYSIALTLLAMMPDAAAHDIRILATDIDRDMLSAARSGEYSDASAKHIDARLRQRWLHQRRDETGAARWSMSDPVRRLVAFRELNLTHEWPMRGPFQVIFCRNTTIYFEPELQTKTWARMAGLMEPGSLLYIGHSERIGASAEFRLVATTAYVRKLGEVGQ